MVRRLADRVWEGLRGLAPKARPGARDPLGPRAERCAAAHLRRRGCRVLRRNLRLAPGEIDILAETPDGGALIVVEVKCRRVSPPAASGGVGAALPPPEAAITNAKRGKLLALAGVVGRMPLARGRPVRIDVVAVEWPPRGEPALRWHVNAVTR